MAMFERVNAPFSVRFLTTLDAVNSTVPALFCRLKLMLLASLSAPVLIVLVTAPPPVALTIGVPETVRLVTVAVVHIVTAVAAVSVIAPVPKLMVRAVAEALENRPVDRVNAPSARVPLVSVVVKAEPRVKLSCSVHVPATPLKVMPQANDVALVFTVLDVVAL